LAFDLLYDCAIKFRDMLATASKRTPHPIPLPSEGLCTTTSQNVRTPRKFFLVVLVLVLDWVSGLDYEDEDDDEDDWVAAAPLRVYRGRCARERGAAFTPLPSGTVPMTLRIFPSAGNGRTVRRPQGRAPAALGRGAKHVPEGRGCP